MQCRRVAFSAVFVLVVGVAVGQAQEARVVTVDQAVELALRNNLSLENERLDVEISRRQKNSVWNRFLPETSVSGTLLRYNEEQTDPAGGGPSPRWGIQGRLSAELNITLQLFEGIRLAILDYQRGVIALEDARKLLERDVRKAFYNLIVLEGQIEIAEEAVEIAREQFERTQINFENGVADEFTLLSARVALESRRPVVGNSRLAFEEAKLGFAQLLGLDIETEIILEGTIEPEIVSLDPDRLIAENLMDRTDLQELRQAVRIQEGVVRAETAALYPILSLGYVADPTFVNDPFGDPWFADLENDWVQPQGAFTISIIQPLDGLVPGSQAQVRISDERTNLAKLQNQLVLATQRAEIEIRSLANRLETTRVSLGVQELNVELAERAYELALEAYNVGSRELLEVRNAEQDLQDARLQLLQEKSNYTAALLDLEYALNTTIEEMGER
ncbi:MAG: TolC family protein [Spirochaetota bacterium]